MGLNGSHVKEPSGAAGHLRVLQEQVASLKPQAGNPSSLAQRGHLREASPRASGGPFKGTAADGAIPFTSVSVIQLPSCLPLLLS